MTSCVSQLILASFALFIFRASRADNLRFTEISPANHGGCFPMTFTIFTDQFSVYNSNPKYARVKWCPTNVCEIYEFRDLEIFFIQFTNF